MARIYESIMRLIGVMGLTVSQVSIPPASDRAWLEIQCGLDDAIMVCIFGCFCMVAWGLSSWGWYSKTVICAGTW
jgi:hypothetical protein